MKIIKIAKCDNNLCGLWKQRGNQHAVVCKKTGRIAEDPIPDWCPLEDASQAVCPECLGFSGHKISCSKFAKPGGLPDALHIRRGK